MYDIDPPSPVLRLSAPRKATQPTALTDRQHMARIAQAGQPVLVFKDCQTGRLLGPSAPFWPPSRAVYAVQSGEGWVEVEALNTLARADGFLAQRIDQI